jgi:hypothetical protein
MTDEDDAGLARRDYLRIAGLAAAAGSAGCGGLPSRAADGDVDETGGDGATPRVPGGPVLDGRHQNDAYWSGPESDRPDDAPTGAHYFATDTGRGLVATESGWRTQGYAGPFVDADRIRGVADYVVTSTAELQAAMDDLDDGATVYVADGTYRTDRWLAVDASDVTVVGQSRRGTTIMPADGANVGGFHVGRNARAENVLIAGIGFHGNDGNMDQSVKRLHAFLVEDARNVTIRDCFATRTSPYHEHDAGGSGFTVRQGAEDVAVVGNYTNDIGDRSIQVAGSYILVRGNRLTNGFDRAVSLEVNHPEGGKRYSRNVSVVNNVGRDNTDGSIIGASQGVPERDGAGNYAIVGNVAYGKHRRVVFLGMEEAARNVSIVGNVGRQADFHERRSGIYVSGNVSNVAVVGNSLRDYTLHGIEIDSGGSNFAVANNSVRNSEQEGIRVDATEASVTGNVVDNARTVGIDVARGGATVTGNTVRNTASHGIVVGPGAPSLVAANSVRATGRRDGTGAGIAVGASDALVATNLVAAPTGTDGGVAEVAGASNNLYVGNRLVDARWNVTGGSRFVANMPAGGPSEAVFAEGEATTLSFEAPYADRPAIEVVPESPVRWGVEWHRTDDGAYEGATVRLEADDADAAPRAEVRVRRR